MDRSLETILTNAKCPTAFITFLKDNEINSVCDLALMAPSEDKVESQIIEPARIPELRIKHKV